MAVVAYNQNMVENKIKLFQNQKIRTIWDEVHEDWLFSAVDICGALTEQPDIAGARNYWKVLKSRLSEEGSELVTKCNRLKMLAQDGKKRETDCFYTQDVLRLIQSIPSKKAEPFKLWLAQVGKEHIDEIADPELAIDRALQTYLKKGYSREWINQRLQSIQVRKELTDEWENRGVKKGIEYAILTDEISRGWSGMTTREYKNFKGLKKESLRDNMTTMEIVFNMLAEATTTELSRTKAPDGFKESKDIAREGGNTAGEARKIVEKRLGKSILTSELPELEELQEEQYHDEKSDFALILAHLERAGSLSVSQIDEFVGDISRRTLHRRLKRMVELGLIESHGATNLARYTIKVKRDDKGSRRGFLENGRFVR